MRGQAKKEEYKQGALSKQDASSIINEKLYQANISEPPSTDNSSLLHLRKYIKFVSEDKQDLIAEIYLWLGYFFAWSVLLGLIFGIRAYQLSISNTKRILAKILIVISCIAIAVWLIYLIILLGAASSRR